jgi:uncharacterized damage-inducible protein DinB
MRNAPLAGCTLAVVLALALAVPAAAHQEGEMAAPAGAGFQSDVAADLERTGEKLLALAEAIPADKYGWRPAEGVRSVSEVFVHAANANTMLPVGMGAAPPSGIELPKDMASVMPWMQQQEATLTAKDDVVAALRESIDYAAGAVRGMKDPALEEEIDLFGFPASRRAYVLILLTHNHEHLGQAIAYARSNGVVPPWSQPPAAAAAEEEAAADGY